MVKLVLAAVLAAAHVAPSHRAVPILMFHVIAAPPASAPYPQLYVPPAEFRAEVDWLARHGYRAVTLDEVFRAWRGRDVLPRRPVVLTFDDGYHTDFTEAMPILRARRWAGVLNMLVANLKPVWGLRPGEVHALVRAGWEIDAHTLTHPDLTTLTSSQAWEEIAGSRAALRRKFRAPVDFFCYPSGRFDTAVAEEVRRAGFEGATTEQFGLASPSQSPYALDRIRVSGGEGAAGLAASFATLGLPH